VYVCVWCARVRVCVVLSVTLAVLRSRKILFVKNVVKIYYILLAAIVIEKIAKLMCVTNQFAMKRRL